MPKKKKTAKQEKFVEEYLKDLNATQAYLRAYPFASYATANVEGPLTLVKPSIRDAINRAKNERAKRTRVHQDKVVRELAGLAFLDFTTFGDGLHNKVKALELLLKHTQIQNEKASESQPVSFVDLIKKANELKKGN